jgi:hypothetical protein
LNAPLSLPANQLAVRRAASGLCTALGWSVLHEVSLPNGRRADLLALRPDGGFACIEVKSGPRDFLVDGKWPEYRAFCDALFFAVDALFPLALLPPDVGVMVACTETGGEAALLRDAPEEKLAPARRRALLHRFATIAANRLQALEDPAVTASFRAALRAE